MSQWDLKARLLRTFGTKANGIHYKKDRPPKTTTSKDTRLFSQKNRGKNDPLGQNQEDLTMN